ncbi:restriction endonuclease subunit S [Helicobacter sp. 23-1045]
MTNTTLFATKGNVPVVTNSSLNNGVSGYVDLEPTEKGNMITYSDTTTSEGIFYQPRDFIGYSHIQGLYPLQDSDKWNKYALLYFVVLFRKASFGLFDYANKFNRQIAKQMTIKLPTNQNNEIAFDFMEKFISAVQKEVIQSVVLWSENRIETTKAIVENH